MYDSVDIATIPANATAVAGYVGGKWPTFHLLEPHWPHAHRLSIAVASTLDAECLDVEPGDATPDRAPAWVKRQHARGVKRPVVYTSVSGMAHVLQLLARAGIARSQVRIFTAHYTGTPHLCGPRCGYGLTTTADATQYTNRALGRNLDASLLATGFWGARKPAVDPVLRRYTQILAALRQAAKAAGGWRKVPRIWTAARHIKAAIKRRSSK